MSASFTTGNPPSSRTLSPKRPQSAGRVSSVSSAPPIIPPVNRVRRQTTPTVRSKSSYFCHASILPITRGSRRPVLARTRPPMAQFNASMHGHQPRLMLHSEATPSARRTRAKPANGGTTLTSAPGTYRHDAHALLALACMLWYRAQPAPPLHVASRHHSRERQRACILRRRPTDRH